MMKIFNLIKKNALKVHFYFITLVVAMASEPVPIWQATLNDNGSMYVICIFGKFL